MLERHGRIAAGRPAESPGEVGLVSLWGNYVSLLGLLFVGLGVLLLVTFFLFQFIFPTSNPYVGIIGYLILPGIFTVGLVIVPLGMLLKAWRLRRAEDKRLRTLRLPRIDLNDRRTRVSLLTFLVFSTFVVLPLLAVSSYEGYGYTESTRFCAKVCHTVMEPEATAYGVAAHSSVGCAACHIAPGAGGAFEAKLQGVHQVYSVLTDTYPQPIKPAITKLRPVREACETCHRPEQFFDPLYKEIAHYDPDESNTRHDVTMLLKTGGVNRFSGRVEGIHMHMVLSARIQYVALDRALQNIPWVRYVNADGQEIIYRSDGKPSDAPRPPGPLRTIECADCHNRTGHRFLPPDRAVDLYMAAGRIDPDLPYVRRQGVRALLRAYQGAEEITDIVQEDLRAFYRKEYPRVWERHRESIERAVQTIEQIYRQNFFPGMNVDWQTYPDNVGHMYFQGCFRCHSGKHVSKDGQVITDDCEACHVFFVADSDRDVLKRAEFQHSMPLVKHKGLECAECHSNGRLMLCRECHASGEWMRILDQWSPQTERRLLK